MILQKLSRLKQWYYFRQNLVIIWRDFLSLQHGQWKCSKSTIPTSSIQCSETKSRIPRMNHSTRALLVINSKSKASMWKVREMVCFIVNVIKQWAYENFSSAFIDNYINKSNFVQKCIKSITNYNNSSCEMTAISNPLTKLSLYRNLFWIIFTRLLQINDKSFNGTWEVSYSKSVSAIKNIFNFDFWLCLVMNVKLNLALADICSTHKKLRNFWN